MKSKIISTEVVLTSTSTDAAVALIMQEIATLIYDDVTQE
jgi:hypothetical protein